MFASIIVNIGLIISIFSAEKEVRELKEKLKELVFENSRLYKYHEADDLKNLIIIESCGATKDEILVALGKIVNPEIKRCAQRTLTESFLCSK